MRLNRRDHKKLLIVDESSAFVGSWNISAVHFGSNGKPWSDSGCILAGDSIGELVTSFENRWKRCFSPQKPTLPQTLRRLSPLAWRREPLHSQAVLMMDDRQTSKAFRRELYHRIRSAHGRVWLTTAYFNPTPKLVASLLLAARSGIDVRILISARSDVAFVHRLSEFFYRELFEGGARIFEYQPAVLHAKTLIAGDWIVLGSLNMNFRSFYRDHEIGVVLSSRQAMTAMSERFLQNLRESQEIAPKEHQARSYLSRLFSFLLFRVRVLF
jgi:cardiolipin synthase